MTCIMRYYVTPLRSPRPHDVACRCNSIGRWYVTYDVTFFSASPLSYREIRCNSTSKSYDRTKNYVNSFYNYNNSTNSSLTNKNHDVAFIIMALLLIGYGFQNLWRRTSRSHWDLYWFTRPLQENMWIVTPSKQDTLFSTHHLVNCS
jgi:hypothetical protein